MSEQPHSETCSREDCDRRDTIWGTCPEHTCLGDSLGDHGPRCDCPPAQSAASEQSS